MSDNISNEQASGSYERRQDTKTEPDYVRRWLEAIELSGQEEKDWRKSAEDATEVYRSEKKVKGTSFNIYHSNIETLVPALYNSLPVPDIRRRFQDSDPVAKMGADILERVISHCIDAYDFDATISDTILDLAITARGVARIVYDAPTGQVGGVEDVVYQMVTCKHVPWAGFRRGPGRTWDDVPWVAFPHYLDRDALLQLSPELGDKVSLDFRLTDNKERQKQDKVEDDIFKRGMVWEVWNREKREVYFISPGYKQAILKTIEDPLGLEGFFPIPRPLYGPHTTGQLTPICPFDIYKELLTELDDLTNRLRKLIKQLRPRGAGPGSPDLERWAKADDGEIVEIKNFAQFLDTPGGFEKLIAWFPLDATVKAVQALFEQRESVKQAIYEVTGLSDILRGATDASETATAQQLKSQWGSIRIRRQQQDVQRFIRDLFRMKAEIIAKHFAPQTLAMITGFNMQDPMFMQAIELLRNNPMRSYRIDIETDSTIKGDVARNMEQMTNFVMGSGEFFSAMGTAVQAGALPMEAAVVIYSSFARSFNLGKEVEDMLDRIGEQAKQPQPPKQDPEQIKAQVEEKKMAMEAQMKEREHGMAMEKFQQIEIPKFQMELELGRMDMQLKGVEMQHKGAEMQMKQQLGQQQLAQGQQQMAMTGEDQKLKRAEFGMKQRESRFNEGAKRSEMKKMGMKQPPMDLPDGGEMIGKALEQMAQMLGQLIVQQGQQQQAALDQILQVVSAPAEVIRGPDGRVSGAQKVLPQRTVN